MSNRLWGESATTAPTFLLAFDTELSLTFNPELNLCVMALLTQVTNFSLDNECKVAISV